MVVCRNPYHLVGCEGPDDVSVSPFAVVVVIAAANDGAELRICGKSVLAGDHMRHIGKAVHVLVHCVCLTVAHDVEVDISSLYKDISIPLKELPFARKVVGIDLIIAS